MKKKGFKLVELLAVIAILAILVIIALPNVMGMFNNAKKSSFTTEVKNLMKGAELEWIQDNITSAATTKTYSTKDGTKLDSVDTRTALHYTITLNANGKITDLHVYNGTFCIKIDSQTGGIDKEDIDNGTNVVYTIADDKDGMNCDSDPNGTTTNTTNP